jgi:hypothetical protein
MAQEREVPTPLGVGLVVAERREERRRPDEVGEQDRQDLGFVHSSILDPE